MAAILKRNRDKNILHGIKAVDLFTGGVTAVDDDDKDKVQDKENQEKMEKEGSGAAAVVGAEGAGPDEHEGHVDVAATVAAKRGGRSSNAWLQLVADCVQVRRALPSPPFSLPPLSLTLLPRPGAPSPTETILGPVAVAL